MEKSRSKRNGTLEFWRFAFAAFVLLFHAEKYILGEPSMAKGVFFGFFPHGAIGVEFFFLLTGLFLAMSADKQRHRQPEICETCSCCVLHAHIIPKTPRPGNP